MKAIELLKGDRAYCLCINNDKSIIKQYEEAIDDMIDAIELAKEMKWELEK